jgi:hypothetical protein
MGDRQISRAFDFVVVRTFDYLWLEIWNFARIVISILNSKLSGETKIVVQMQRSAWLEKK